MTTRYTATYREASEELRRRINDEKINTFDTMKALLNYDTKRYGYSDIAIKMLEIVRISDEKINKMILEVEQRYPL